MKQGDTVQLKSGGPNMTIVRVVGFEKRIKKTEIEDKLMTKAEYQNGDIICEWFDKTERKTGAFKATSLYLT